MLTSSVALVTGAGGFIGSHLTEELVRRGVRVRAFVHYNSRGDRGHLERLPGSVTGQVEVVSGDIRDADTVRRAARGVHVVFHLAAHIGIPYSYVSPRDVVDTNVLGTLNILEAARDNQAVRVIHTSTSEVYGTAVYTPIDEAHPLQGQSPYSASKIGAEQLALSYHRSFGLPVTVIRPFNTYGPRQSTRAVVPTIVTQALRGACIHLGSTRPTRDLVFVKDTVGAFLSVAESEQVDGEVLNIGTGIETSIADLVDRIGRIIGHELSVEEDMQRLRPVESEVERLVADASKTRRLCGWRSGFTLEAGLEQTVDWIRANLSLYQSSVYAV